MINCNTQGLLENSSIIIQYGLPIVLMGLLSLSIIYFLIKIYKQHLTLNKKCRKGKKGETK
jgi:hypothetical protein